MWCFGDGSFEVSGIVRCFGVVSCWWWIMMVLLMVVVVVVIVVMVGS